MGWQGRKMQKCSLKQRLRYSDLQPDYSFFAIYYWFLEITVWYQEYWSSAEEGVKYIIAGLSKQSFFMKTPLWQLMKELTGFFSDHDHFGAIFFLSFLQLHTVSRVKWQRGCLLFLSINLPFLSLGNNSGK